MSGADDVLVGSVLYWKPNKNKGVIRCDGAMRRNVFFTHEAFAEPAERESVAVGTRVAFTVGRNERGEIAKTLRVLQ